VPEGNLSKKRELLTAAFDVYCIGIAGCGEPEPDRVPVRMMSSVSDIYGSAITESCPPQHQLLSCGIQNSKNWGSADENRYAIPLSGTACQCKDTAGAKCTAWCTNIHIPFVAIQKRIQGTGTVSCRSPFQVSLLLSIPIMSSLSLLVVAQSV